MQGVSDILDMDLAELVELAKARQGQSPAGALRIVYAEAPAEGLSQVPTVSASVTGVCVCIKGWVFGDDGAKRCLNCAGLRGLAERTSSAGLPYWGLRVRQEWRDAEALPVMARWADRVLAGRIGPLLHGSTGIGKSWRAMAVALAALDAGATVRWVSWPALPHALRDGYAAGRTGASMLRRLQSVDLLILDDIGAEAGKREWLDDVALQVLGPRSDNRAPIVATTNLEPAELAKALGDRAYSRLTACCRAVRVDGADRRAT